MKKIIVLIALLTLAAAAHAADAADPDTSRWKEGGKKDCETTSRNDVGCYLGGGATAVINVSRLSGKALTFTQQEWHKACGTVGGVVHKQTRTDVTASPVSIDVLASGPGMTCREVYFTDCKVDGVDKPCKDVLSANYVWYKGNKQ